MVIKTEQVCCYHDEGRGKYSVKAAMSWVYMYRTWWSVFRAERSLHILYVSGADPGGRAIKGVGMRPLACWNCGFESNWGHESLV